MARNSGSASGESSGRELWGWDEAAVGASREETPVEAQWLRWGPGALDPICRTAVYVTRSYGGVGGGGRKVFPYPK